MPTKRILVPCQTGQAYMLEVTDAEIAMLLERRGIPFETSPLGTVTLLRPSTHDERARAR